MLLEAGHSIARGRIRCPACGVDVSIFPGLEDARFAHSEAGRVALELYRTASEPPAVEVYARVGLPPGEEALRQKFRLFHRALQLHLARRALRHGLPGRAAEVLERLDGCLEADPAPEAVREILELLSRAPDHEPIVHLIRAQFTVDDGAGTTEELRGFLGERQAQMAEAVRRLG